MVIELENSRAAGPDDPEGIVVVAQNGVITVKKILSGDVVPFQEFAPDGDFDEALADKLNFLTAAGFQVVG